MRKKIHQIYGLVFTISLTLLSGCRRDGLFNDLKRGDYRLVATGAYDGTADYIGSGAHEKIVAEYRRTIEARPDLLRAVTRHVFPAAPDLRYEFKMALRDRDRDRFILRYYAPHFHGDVYAGYQLFFVGDGTRMELIRIYCSEVPLE